ncbi:MAG: acetoacetate decarboxylase family protein [Myxococcota bacterium]
MVNKTHGYCVPQDAPLYQRPPCRYTDSRLQLISFVAANRDALAALVPAPLVPNPDGQAALMVNRLTADVFGTYHEVALLVPSSLNGVEGAFTAYMYLDQDNPMGAGREIWGFPKKLATIGIEGDGQIATRVERGGSAIIESVLELGPEIAPSDVPFNPTFFNLKLVPSVREGAPPDVMQLTSTVLQDVEIMGARAGGAKVELRSTPNDPLGAIAPKEVLGAVEVHTNFTLTFGEVAHDYLREG